MICFAKDKERSLRWSVVAQLATLHEAVALLCDHDVRISPSSQDESLVRKDPV